MLVQRWTHDQPVGGGGDGFFLADPRFFVLNVAEELLQTQRIRQLLLPLLQRLLQGAVAFDEVVRLLSDVVGVEVAGRLELLALDLDAVDAILMRRDVRLQQRVLLLQILHARQVLRVSDRARVENQDGGGGIERGRGGCGKEKGNEYG